MNKFAIIKMFIKFKLLGYKFRIINKIDEIEMLGNGFIDRYFYKPEKEDKK